MTARDLIKELIKYDLDAEVTAIVFTSNDEVEETVITAVGERSNTIMLQMEA